VIDLFAALRGFPALPGAACRGKHHLFDEVIGPDRDRIQAEALRICAACEELLPCRRWLMSLPRRERPYGVVAGQVRTPR
jgi:hypothetical protein